MHPRFLSLALLAIFAATVVTQSISATAATSSQLSRQPPAAQAIPWIDDLVRVGDPSWFYKALGKIIEMRTGKSALEGEHIAKRVGCLIAKGSTSPEHVYTALNYTQPIVPVPLNEAMEISNSIAEYKTAHPHLFDVAKKILKRIC
jgi:hypothetical protein